MKFFFLYTISPQGWKPDHVAHLSRLQRGITSIPADGATDWMTAAHDLLQQTGRYSITSSARTSQVGGISNQMSVRLQVRINYLTSAKGYKCMIWRNERCHSAVDGDEEKGLCLRSYTPLNCV
jgi:hypothetical protein